MARRVGAVLAMAAVVAVALFLVWRVWLHREGTVETNEGGSLVAIVTVAS